ncbi:MAG: 4-alpha-glucanotransferase [Deltaproteobacteria bacterium]|nr:MAG: 4-alpha-glucanotransferase [Deltaproteobacteria bacterium]TMA60357.1 MAG: 4-alpha-glucanotransferase [Deltaproteobacteria bacterium]
MSEGRREAGILLPLFSVRGRRDWGIGEIADLAPLVRWLAAAGHGLLQLLPIVETAPGERSPYTVLSAFAIDSIYLALREVEDFVAAGGEAALAPDDRTRLDGAREQANIDYDAVRAVKRRALEIAFEHFLATEWRGRSARAAAFEGFRAAEADWLDSYSLFRACKESRDEGPWTAWEPALRDREPTAVAVAARQVERRRLFHEYVQWVAAEQWSAVRREATAVGVRLKGDLPFMVAGDSADVWVRQDEFDLGCNVGAPPDAFSERGQDWGLPVYRWDAMAAADFRWLRGRMARAGRLFDAVRVDHVVGYYRMWIFCPGADGRFVPDDETRQLALGERLLGVALSAAGRTQVIAEDLGTVPPFVRRSLTALGIPGYRVLRWEEDAGAFRDPLGYPRLSVATSGTHDTSTLAAWWSDELGDRGRRALASVPLFAALHDAGAEFTPAVHGALLDGLYAAGSDLVVVPLQDAFGGRERVNVPATVGPHNWGYRMPWTVEELGRGSSAAVGARLRSLAARHARTGG